jgi:hypothetical protein
MNLTPQQVDDLTVIRSLLQPKAAEQPDITFSYECYPTPRAAVYGRPHDFGHHFILKVEARVGATRLSRNARFIRLEFHSDENTIGKLLSTLEGMKQALRAEMGSLLAIKKTHRQKAERFFNRTVRG